MHEKAIYHAGYRRVVGTLREARIRLGLSQFEVASNLGLGRTWLAKIEQCELRLDLLRFVRLCEVYRLDPAELVRSLRVT